MWDLIVSVPDHCLYFYFAVHSKDSQGPQITPYGQQVL